MTVRKRLMPIPGKFTMPAKCSNHPGSDHPPLATQAISLALKFGGVAGVITLAMGPRRPAGVTSSGTSGQHLADQRIESTAASDH